MLVVSRIRKVCTHRLSNLIAVIFHYKAYFARKHIIFNAENGFEIITKGKLYLFCFLIGIQHPISASNFEEGNVTITVRYDNQNDTFILKGTTRVSALKEVVSKKYAEIKGLSARKTHELLKDAQQTNLILERAFLNNDKTLAEYPNSKTAEIYFTLPARLEAIVDELANCTITFIFNNNDNRITQGVEEKTSISDFLRKVKVRHKSFPKEAVLVLNGKRIEKSKNLSKLLDEQYNATETTYARAFTFLVFDNEEAWEEYHPFFFATCWKHPWATTTLTLLIIGLFALFMGSFTSSSQGDDTTPSQAKRKTQEMSPSSLSSHSLAVEKASIFATKEESNHVIFIY